MKKVLVAFGILLILSEIEAMNQRDYSSDGFTQMRSRRENQFTDVLRRLEGLQRDAAGLRDSFCDHVWKVKKMAIMRGIGRIAGAVSAEATWETLNYDQQKVVKMFLQERDIDFYSIADDGRKIRLAEWDAYIVPVKRRLDAAESVLRDFISIFPKGRRVLEEIIRLQMPCPGCALTADLILDLLVDILQILEQDPENAEVSGAFEQLDEVLSLAKEKLDEENRRFGIVAHMVGGLPRLVEDLDMTMTGTLDSLGMVSFTRTRDTHKEQKKSSSEISAAEEILPFEKVIADASEFLDSMVLPNAFEDRNELLKRLWGYDDIRRALHQPDVRFDGLDSRAKRELWRRLPTLWNESYRGSDFEQKYMHPCQGRFRNADEMLTRIARVLPEFRDVIDRMKGMSLSASAVLVLSSDYMLDTLADMLRKLKQNPGDMEIQRRTLRELNQTASAAYQTHDRINRGRPG